MQEMIAGDNTTTLLLLICFLLEEMEDLKEKEGVSAVKIQRILQYQVTENVIKIFHACKMSSLPQNNPKTTEISVPFDLMSTKVSPKREILYNLAFSSLFAKLKQRKFCEQLADVCQKAMRYFVGEKTVKELKENRINLSLLPIAQVGCILEEINANYFEGMVFPHDGREGDLSLRTEKTKILLMEDNLGLEIQKGQFMSVEVKDVNQREDLFKKKRKMEEEKIETLSSFGVKMLLTSGFVDPFCMEKLSSKGVQVHQKLRKV